MVCVQLFLFSFFFFSAAGCMLPTFSAASGCALGYFLINKHSIVLSQNTLEEYLRIYYTVYYGPLIGSHESSLAYKKGTVVIFAVNK